MNKRFHPLLVMIAKATSTELQQYIDYLKAENQILRSKLPRRVDVTPAEREKLVKVGKPLGGQLKELMSIVSPRTFSREVHIAGITATPDGEWMAQQARNLCMFLAEQPESAKYIVCDRDTKFTKQFEEIVKAEDIELVKVAVRAPNRNAYAERFVQTIKHECLDHLIVFGEAHLRHIVSEFVAHYHSERPHLAKGNLPPLIAKAPDAVDSLGPDSVVCQERLGGLLKHYQRRAA
jgi:hypothetical protein